jgi:hypothetical protein
VLGSVPLRTSLRRLAALCLAAFALVAGCGGSDKPSQEETFKKQFIPINSHILQVNQELARTLTGQHGHTDAKFEQYMEINASGQREIIRELKTLDPPPALAAQTAELTKNAGLIADDMESLIAATKVRDLKAVKKAYNHMIATADKLQKNRQFLAKKTGAQVEQT